MFSLFKKKPATAAEVQTHIVVPEGVRNLPAALRAASTLRRTNGAEPKRGMWVRYGNMTGILTALEPGDVATVMLVDADQGLNVSEVHVAADLLTQARLNEIPTARRPKPSAGRAMGYV